MKIFILAAAALAVVVPSVPAMAQSAGADRGYGQDRRDDRNDRNDYRGNRDDRDARNRGETRRDARANQRARDWRNYRNYDWNRPERGGDRYYADNYYRSGSQYRERTLRANDRVYRGQNGQYYCRRSDGGIAGGVFGNLVAPGDSNTLGTILGAAGGALAGRAIDRGNDRGNGRGVRCR
jgi:hypothetical protein